MNRDLRLLLVGQSISGAGDGIYVVALPWFILAKGGGPQLLGLALTAYGIPRALLLYAGGRGSDRFSPQRLMIVGDTLRMSAVAVLGFMNSSADYVVITGMSVVVGVGDGLFSPASYALVPSLVSSRDLMASNGAVATVAQASTAVGPLVGGLVVGGLGPQPGFFLDAVSFLASLAALTRINFSQKLKSLTCSEAAEPTSVSVWHLIRSNAGIPISLGISVVANLALTGLSEVALPVLLRHNDRLHADGYGLMVALFATGGVMGALVTTRAPAQRRPALTGSLLLLAELPFMASLPSLQSLLLIAGSLAIIGALNGYAGVTLITAMQLEIPPALIGSMMGVFLMASAGTYPIATYTAGLLVRAAGAPIYFPVAAGVAAVAVLVGLSFDSWRNFGVPRFGCQTAGDDSALGPE